MDRHTVIDTFVSFPKVAGYEGEYREYDINNGGAKSRFLYKYGNFIKLNEFIIQGETYFPEHEHHEDEYAVVVKGEGGILYKNGDEVPFGIGKAVYTPKGKKHKAYFPEETTVVVISIPASEDYL